MKCYDQPLSQRIVFSVRIWKLLLVEHSLQPDTDILRDKPLIIVEGVGQNRGPRKKGSGADQKKQKASALSPREKK